VSEPMFRLTVLAWVDLPLIVAGCAAAIWKPASLKFVSTRFRFTPASSAWAKGTRSSAPTPSIAN